MRAAKSPALAVIAHPSAGTRPVSAYGSPVTPDATQNAYGAWTSYGVPSDLYETTMIDVFVSSVSSASRLTMIDIGMDVAGGTSFTSIHSSGSLDLVAGQPGAYNDGAAARGVRWRLPFRFPKGATIGVRGKQNNATPAAFRVAVRAWGKPIAPHLSWYATTVEKFGTSVLGGSQGTAITPGTSSDGAWTAIGSVTTKPIRFLTFGYAIDSASFGGVGYHVDVGYGDVSDPTIVIADAHVETSSAEALWFDRPGEFCDIPIGKQLYARVQSGTATVDANHSIALYGFA